MKKIPWTEYELQAIRTYWPAGGYEAVAPHTPLRTKLAVQKMASELGVHRDYITAGSGTRRLTHHTSQQVKACQLMRAWRGPVKKGNLKWAA